MTHQIINNVIWGEDVASNPPDLLRPSDAFIKTGWPQAEPIRPYGNWVQFLAMSNLAALETDGQPVWQTTVEYSQFGYARYGGEWYVSLQNENIGQIPTSTLGSWWQRFADFVGTPTGGGATTEETISAYNEAYFYPHPVYNSVSSVDLTGDNILCTDKVIYPLDTNPLNITAGTLSTLVWYYVYVDIPATGTVVASDVSIITTPPTWDPALQMMVNGTKRCIGYIEGAEVGSGQIEPFVVSNGWYERLNGKRRILLAEPAPYTNLSTSAGMPSMGGINGACEIVSFSYESINAAMSSIGHSGLSGDVNENGLTDSSESEVQVSEFNGNNLAGTRVADIDVENVMTTGRGVVTTDSSGNIIVSGQATLTARDETLAIWLSKFSLPAGVNG